MQKPRRVPRTKEQAAKGNSPKDYNGRLGVDSEPCPFLPGTPEKILLLMWRADRKIDLFDDAVTCLDSDRQHVEESSEACHAHKDNFGGLHNVFVTGDYIQPKLSHNLKDFLWRVAKKSPSRLKAFPDRILAHLPLELRDSIRSAPAPRWGLPDEDAETFNQGAA